ncbi:hypothetical protein LOTGIDRAFT_132034, partial [Lottia gigantea]
GLATRKCMSNGEWFVHPEFNTSWTNYSACTPQILQNPTHPGLLLQRLELMYHIGYGVSIIALTAAFLIMMYFRRLRCPRNIVHLNLFMSFIFRGALSFIKDGLMLLLTMFHYVLLANYFSSVLIHFISLSTSQFISFHFISFQHWQCKLLLAMFHYVLLANYFWLFIEGLNLHTLIIVAVFSEKNRIKWYIGLGWLSPLIFVIPWVVVRALLEDTLCWNTNPSPGFLWIMRAPVVISIIVNFAFFINIVRVLFSKLKGYNTSKSRRCRHRRLAKSTLVLIPLFGVHYMLFIGFPDNLSAILELVRLYYEMFFNSFEGFLVALLYCFLNQEVQSEIRKMWVRYKLKTNSRKFRRLYWQTASSKFVKNPSQWHLMNPISSEKRDVQNPNLNSSSDNSSEDKKRLGMRVHLESRQGNGFMLKSPSNSIECRVALTPEDVYG